MRMIALLLFVLWWSANCDVSTASIKILASCLYGIPLYLSMHPEISQIDVIRKKRGLQWRGNPISSQNPSLSHCWRRTLDNNKLTVYGPLYKRRWDSWLQITLGIAHGIKFTCWGLNKMNNRRRPVANSNARKGKLLAWNPSQWFVK